MKANLFLHADAVKYNGTDSEHEFKSKFSTLMNDLIEIQNDYGNENTIKVSTTLCYGTVSLFGQQNIYQVADDLEPEERNFIYSLMGNSAEVFDNTLNEIEELCNYTEEETECNTVVYLNKPVPSEPVFPVVYMTFDRYEIVYGKDSWRTVRRQIMGNHPGTPHAFLQECNAYFPNIVFHPNCESSIEGYLDLIPRKIVYYLSCMNDELLKFRAKTGITDENALLADFCGKYSFDEAGTRQSTTKKKNLYQYDFLKAGCLERKYYKTITCDPHMKMSSCDSNCKKNPNDFVGRIYFHFGDDEVAPGKLLVGSIGPHVA